MQQAQGAQSETLDIFQLMAALKRGWLVILLSTLVLGGLAAAYALSLTPIYRATAEVLIVPRQKNLFNNLPLGQVMASDILLVESQARLAVSDAVLARVVDRLDLAADGEFNGQEPPGGPLAALKRLLGMDDWGPAGDARAAALRTLRKRVEAKRAAKTFVVEISAESRDAEKAARIANAVAEAFIAEQTEAVSGEAGQLARQLDERLEQLRREVEEAEAKVAAYRQQHGIIATRGDQLETQARLARLGEELVKARTRAAAAKARHEQLQEAIRAGVVDALPEALTSPVLARLRAEHARAASAYSALKETLGPRHPRLLTARAEVERLARLIREELKRLAARVRNEYEAAKAEVAAIERNLERLRARTSQTKLAEVKLRALEREAAARRKVFESFLLKARETSEARRIRLADARLISPADVPQYPVRPRKKLIVGLAMLAGLGLGMAWAVLRDAARRRRQRRAMAVGEAAANVAQVNGLQPASAQQLAVAPVSQTAAVAPPAGPMASLQTPAVTSPATSPAAAPAMPQARPAPQPAVAAAPAADVAQPHSAVAEKPKGATSVAPSQEPQRRKEDDGRHGVAALPLLATLPALAGVQAGKGLAAALPVALAAVLAHAAQPGYAFGRAVRRILLGLGHQRFLTIMAARRGQGASLLAFSLALAQARRRKRVLLVDGDGRRAALSGLLREGDAQAVRLVAAGMRNVAALVQRDGELGVDVLPLALLMREEGVDAAAVSRQLAELFSAYDAIVFDSAPLSEAEDVFGLAELMDAVVLIAADAECRSAQVQEMAALLKAAGLGAGLVCNAGVAGMEAGVATSAAARRAMDAFPGGA